MSRPQRISFPGALFHITIRGNNRENIFIDDKDYKRYLKLLRDYKKELGYLLYAYVLMSNHVHLLIQIGDGSGISKIMQKINTAYSKYFTLKYNRVGHLFQGRFHDVLVDKDEYLLVLTQYIHLNPVRANLTVHPEDYRWSSCSSYFNEGTDFFVDAQDVLLLLGSSAEEQRSVYRKLIKLEIAQKSRQDYIKDKLNSSKVLGSKGFVEKLAVTSGTK